MKCFKVFVIIFIIFLFLFRNDSAFADIDPSKSTFKETENIKNEVKEVNVISDFPDLDWWNRFNDPKLRIIIERSLSNNLEVKMAQLRISENKALVQVARAKQLPTISINPVFSRYQNSKNLTRPSIDQFQGNGPKLFSPGDTYSIMQLPLSTNYEADFWLKNLYKTKVQKKYLDVAKLELKLSHLSIASEVSSTYFNLLLLNKLIDIELKQIELYKDYLKLVNDQYKSGLIPYFEPLKIENLINHSENNLNDYRIQKGLFENYLSVLAGESPGSTEELTTGNLEDINFISDIQAGVPSELCLRRPDILMNEAILSAQKLEISIARKEFFPSLNLTGQFGYSSTELSNLLDWKSHFASFVAGVSQSIFTGGSKRANLRYQKLKYEELLYNYNQSILKAFQEVDNAMVSLKERLKGDTVYKQSVNIAFDRLNLFKGNYEQGLVSYLEVLECESNLLDMKKRYYQNKASVLIDYVSLYKSLGGGY